MGQVELYQAAELFFFLSLSVFFMAIMTNVLLSLFGNFLDDMCLRLTSIQECAEVKKNEK
jgi:hypothetical protein